MEWSVVCVCVYVVVCKCVCFCLVYVCVCASVCVCFVSVCPYVPISIAFNCCIMVVRLHSRLVHLFLAFVSEAAMAASKQVVVYIEHLACMQYKY